MRISRRSCVRRPVRGCNIRKERGVRTEGVLPWGGRWRQRGICGVDESGGRWVTLYARIGA